MSREKLNEAVLLSQSLVILVAARNNACHPARQIDEIHLTW
jgi:hypothetical protein